MAIERKDRIVRYDILEYFKRAQDALNRRLYALKRELQALADKYSRLDTVETGAQVNIINGVKVKNEDITTVDDKVVTIDLGDYTKNEVTEVLKAKLDGIHEFASEVVVNPQREDGVTLAHISVNGEDKFIKRGAIEYGELEHIPATFPPSEHNHDERYYGKAETESKLDLKSDITHLHDDRYYTESEADNLLSQKSDIGHTHSQYLTAGSMLNTANLQGIISVDNLPNAALERLVNVADDTARFALTEASVQLGDTVKVASTGLMYIIKDIARLNSEAGYEVYTAGSASAVPWSGVTGKPSTYAPSAHTHDDRYYTESEINTKLASKQNTLSATGSATKGVYIDSSGTAKAMSYSVNKDVPSDAKFTDTVYTHPTTAGNKHIPSGGSSGQILTWSADGTAVWKANEAAYTHPNSGVTAGTYRSVTVNAQGHVTGGSNPTTLAGYGITDAPTKTGGGASGTWGINISGNANNATKWNGLINDLTTENNTDAWIPVLKDNKLQHTTKANMTVAKANKLTDYAIPNAHNVSTSATVYIFLGTWSGTSDGYSLILDIYTGEGWNALANQNDHINLFVKDSWQDTASATSAFGGVAHRYSPVGRNANNFSVALYATATNSVNVYLVVSPNIYSTGFYTVSMHGGTWTHKGTGSTSAPGGTNQECVNYDIMLTQKDSSGNIIIS